MPTQSTITKAKKDKRAGKSASTQAGEFVHDEIDKIRGGEHGARNGKQAIAIGLSEARRAGVKVGKNPNKKSAAKKTARKASSETSQKRSQASLKALKKEPTSSVSKSALSKQAHQSATKRGPASRKKAAAKAVRTKEKEGLVHRGRKSSHSQVHAH